MQAAPMFSLTPICVVRLVDDPAQRIRPTLAVPRSGMAVTTHDLVDLWLSRSTSMAIGDRAPLSRSTMEGYRCAAKNLLAWLPDVEATKLRPADLQSVVSTIHSQRGPGAAKAAYSYFAMAWKYAVDTEELPPKRCPTALVRAPKTRRRNEDWVRLETVQAIYVAASTLAEERKIPRLKGDAIRLALLTGLRIKSDLLRMRTQQVDYTAKVVAIRIKKNGKGTALPVSDDALAIFAEREARAVGGYLFPGQGNRGHIDNVYHAWSRVLDEVEQAGHNVCDADGKRIVPHHCRHVRVAHCLDAGESPMLVGLGVGQSDPLSVRHYAGSRIDSLRGPAETFAALVRPGDDVEPKDKTAKVFAERLAMAMAKAEKTTEDVAEWTGVTPGAVRVWLRGTSTPDLAKTAKIAKRLRVSTDYLMGVSGR